ncbi:MULTISPECIES: selenium binding protein [unclassified Lactococcus]|uniref:selenium binding protein n=1 Tax=unclassified Lactococcus TaxID=2643510 RepID=UPI0011C7BA80|nr:MULTISPECIES: selenium binding protein [unclassified Lactococcus]MQW24091.1 selenium binding protein [Lactococcus sp. dk101]TXK36573.1 selenium binding protein [Lactococcus sp. dk310]TXK36579.1 selenium binding protein [Lactococcus sp. dk310]TXK46408.1 selenium binding protein [Lactococcus sp. dk322]TXK46414.1 selenium binding protein [Lactococcus sp. dk322]
MYENYTHQSLANKKYRELLGTAIYVFNSNNSFIIENILNNDDYKKYTWHRLIDLTSGNVAAQAKKSLLREGLTSENKDLANKINVLFDKLCEMRNRIIHSFAITDQYGEQILATKEKNGNQFIITTDILMNFIKDNDRLSTLLHKFRGY